MNSEKKQRLEEAIVGIRHEHGVDALRPADALRPPGGSGAKSSIPHLSTGFAVLDRALGADGLPRGHLTQLSGTPTSGAMTLACKVLAEATGEAVICIDLPHTFDADYAARCGVDTASLLLVQPPSLDHAFETLTALVDTAAAAVLVLDTAEEKRHVDNAALNRLMSALYHSRCALMFVQRAGTPLFSEKAAVRLHLRRERWLWQRQDVNGYRTQVRILKNQWGRSGQTVRLVVGFSTVVRGDGA
jgi:recombination protein RecA